MSKIKIDLHPIYNDSKKILAALENGVNDCVSKNIKTLEIIPGKGSGKLKEKVIRFLQQKHIKNQYHRLDKDSKNHGRIFVYFKH